MLIITFSLFIVTTSFSQQGTADDGNTNKGNMYFYWGWNWSWYGKSDINFAGNNYDFVLRDVVASDRESKFSLDTYFSPVKFTTPQYNFRVGYYFKDNWDISFGIDHMKYVVQQDQRVQIDGYIDETDSAYNNVYLNNTITLTEDFLQFEHTDGLNYVNVEVRHTDKIFIKNIVDVSLKEGLGIGFLYPKTNTTLLQKENYDQFHLSGYGVSGIIGLNVSFSDKFFIQSEFKGGYIDLPNVRTTRSKADIARHDFFFTQLNIVFGGIISLNSKRKNKPKPY